MKSLTRSQWLLVGFILLFNIAAQAQTAPLTDISVVNMLTASMQDGGTKLMAQSLLWLGTFMGLQFVVTNFGLLKSGADIDAVGAKLLGSILWFGFCLYVIENGPPFIDRVGLQILTTWGSNIPSPGSIVATTLSMSATLLTGAVAAGQFNGTAGNILSAISFAILVVGIGFALKIFMLQMELGLVVLLSPLSFSFLGLNALKDQGIAPFKALISLVYRMILLGIIMTAFTVVASVMTATIKSFDWTNLVSISKTVETILTSFAAYIFLAFMAYKSDALAAALASGTTNMGTADVAGAAAAGAALGAAAASGGSALGGVKIPDALSAVMSHMSGSGVGVSTATLGSGTGGVVGTAPSKSGAPSMSMSPGNTGATTPATEQGGAAADSPTATDRADAGQKAYQAGADAQAAGASPQNVAAAATNAGMAALGGGTPNQLPEVAAAEERKTERDAAREQRRQERTGGSAATAGIGGTGTAPSRTGKSFGEHLGTLNQHVAQEKAAVHVSISAHHE